MLVAYLACSALAVPTYALALWRVLTLRLTGCGGAGVVEVKCVRQINTPKLPLGRFFFFVCLFLVVVGDGADATAVVLAAVVCCAC